MRALILASILAVAGCATAPSPSATAAVETALTAAEKAATLYAHLPVCPAAGLCSDPATVVKIKAADNVAYAAAVQMRAGAATPEAVAALVAQLVALVPVK